MRGILLVFFLIINFTNAVNAAEAALTQNQCSVTDNSCGVEAINKRGKNFAEKEYQAAMTAPGPAAIPIDLDGRCYYVDNSTRNRYFIPFNSTEEWLAFIANAPSGLNLDLCVVADRFRVVPNRDPRDGAVCRNPDPTELFDDLGYVRRGTTTELTKQFSCTVKGRCGVCGCSPDKTWTQQVTTTYFAGDSGWKALRVQYDGDAVADPPPLCTYTAGFAPCPTACGQPARTLYPTSCTRNYDRKPVGVANCEGQTKYCAATRICDGCGADEAKSIIFLQDLTSSYFDDIDNLRAKFPYVVWDGDLSSSDMALVRFGDMGDSWMYTLEQAVVIDSGFRRIDSNRDYLSSTVSGWWPIWNGGDYPEAQFYAIIKVLDTLGGSARHPLVVVLSTDAPAHNGGWYPNMESVANKLRQYNARLVVLQAPIYYGMHNFYRDFINGYGLKGSVVDLSADSNDIADKFLAGVKTCP